MNKPTTSQQLSVAISELTEINAELQAQLEKQLHARREYRDALVKLDELSLMLGETLRHIRIGWDCPECDCESELRPINQIAKQIGEAIPKEIRRIL